MVFYVKMFNTCNMQLEGNKITGVCSTLKNNLTA